MIVCQCNAISDHDIRAAVNWMRAADPQTIITPGKVYRALGKRPDCGGCLPLFIDTMQQCATLQVPPILRNLRPATQKELPNEGRHDSHRLSEQGAAQ